MKTIGKYEIIKELGRGGFGVVYQARDTRLERLVALKMLHAHLSGDPSFVNRFEQEARAIAALDHPGIVKIYDVDDAEGHLYLAMAYLAGPTLRAMIQTGGPMSLDQALPLLHQLAAALDYAHDQGVIHRDLKPGNIIVSDTSQGPQAVLLDFGLAKALGAASTLSSSGVLLGSPEYMAPEQADPNRTAEVGPAADRYALGIVAYELLTGRVPFPGNTPSTLYAHEHKAPPSPQTLRPDLPAPAAEALLKMLAKAPIERYPTAGAFVAALMAAHQTSQQSAQLAALYEQMQTARERQDWAEVLALGGRLSALDPGYRNVSAEIAEARRRLQPPPQPAPAPPMVEPSPQSPLPAPSRGPAQAEPQGASKQGQPVPKASQSRQWLWGLAAGLVGLVCLAGLGLSSLFNSSSTATPTPTLPVEIPTEPAAAPAPADSSASSLEPGATQVRESDGMTMVYVPAGSFQMGSADGDSNAQDDEKPQHQVTLDAFWLDQTEVTVAMFGTFVEATAYETTAEKEGFGWFYNAEAREAQQLEGANWQHPAGPDSEAGADHPVVQVSWDDATAYCEWAGGRLPTEAEWEYAARGPESFIYPWGNGFDKNRLNFCDKNCEYSWKDETADDGYEQTAPVGSYPSGASWVGALDLSGNVWEWLADWYGDYSAEAQTNPTGPESGEFRVLRGGSCINNGANVRAAYRTVNSDPDKRNDYIGFRCAAPPGN